MADIASVWQFIINGEDKSKPAFDSFGKNVNAAKEGITALGSSAKLVYGTLGTLAGAIGVGFFASMVKDTIEAQAALAKLAQTTGFTVESLSAIKSAASVTGTDFDKVTTGLAKLDKAMFEAATTGGTAAQAFKGLGISVVDATGKLRAPSDVLLEVAGRFSDMEEGATKAALAQQLFGKAGNALIPVLNEIGDAAQYAGKVTEQQAAVAEDLVQNWTRLQSSGKALWNTIASAVAPALDALVRGFLAVINQGGGLSDIFKKLAADGTLQSFAQRGAIVIAEFADAMVDLVNVASKVPKALADSASYIKGFSEVVYGGWLIATGQIKKGADLAATGLEDMRDGFHGVGEAFTSFKPSTKFTDAVTSAVVTMANFNGKVREGSPALEGFAKATEAASSSLRKLLDPITELIDKLGKEGVALDAQLASLQQYGVELKSTTLLTTQYELEHGKLGQTLLAVTALYPQLGEALRNAAQAQAAHNDEVKTAIDLEKVYLAAVKAHTDSLAKSVNAVQDEISKEEQRGAAFGKTRAELVDLTIAQEESYVASLRMIDGADAEIQAAELRIAAYRKLRDVVSKNDQIEKDTAAWTDFFKTITDRGAAFISDFVQHGSSAFKKLWTDFKTWALEALAKIAAQQILINLTGGSGAGAAGGITNLLSGGSGGGGAGGFSPSSLLNLFGGSGGTLMSSAGSLLFGVGTAGAAAMGAGFSAGVATLGIAAEAGVAAIGGMSAAIGAMAAVAIPVVGWIAAIGFALYAAFGNKGGGPKVGGFSASGEIQPVGGDNGRFFTPNQNDAQLQQTTDAILATYHNIATGLGIRSNSVGFALGFDKDPHGTADNRVSSGAYVNGQQVYGVRDLGVGRDDKELTAALELEAKRAVLAALQASDMPKYLADVLNSVDAASATSDQIDAILKTAAAFKQAVDTVAGLGDQFAAMDPDQIAAFISALGGIDNVMKTFSYVSDNFTTAADKAAKAQQQLTDGFKALGLEVPKDHAAFLQLLNGLDLTTEAGRQTYASVLALSGVFVQVRGTADQAAAALNGAADALDNVSRSAHGLGKGDGTNGGNVGGTAQNGRNPRTPTDTGAGTGAVDDGLAGWYNAGGGGSGIIDGINDGTAAASAAAAEQIIKAIQDAVRNIGEYLHSLKLSDLSPLTPLQKLTEAANAFSYELKLAQGGDLKAMQDITSYASDYLKQARDFYASGSPYSSIFNDVTGGLSGITGAGVSTAGSSTDSGGTSTVASGGTLAGSLPANSPLASKADLEALGQKFVDTIKALADAGTKDAEVIVAGGHTDAQTVVDGVRAGSR